MNYLAAILFLYLSHAIPSAPGIRAALFDRLGARVFRAVYSMLSTVAAVWFVWAYITTDIGGFLYAPLPGAAILALVLMPVALFLMIARISTPYGELGAPRPVQGIYRITRFPGSQGIFLWALVHLLATGDAKRVAAFSVFALIAVTALIKNERLLSRETSEAAQDFRAATSFLPFGRGSREELVFAMKEIGWRRAFAALGAFLALLLLHPVVLGVAPLAAF